MDGSLTRSAHLGLTVLLFISHCTSNVVAGCLASQKKWVNANERALITCNLDGEGHFWWKGRNICDPSDFVRFGVGNFGCMDGSPFCRVDYTVFNRESSTFICCSENGPTQLEEARTVNCSQIAVCPDSVEMTVPPVVQTGKTAKAYIKVITKPTPSPSLQLINIEVERGPSINYTQSLITFPESTEDALKVFYTFEFQVPFKAVEDSSTTLKFVPLVSKLPSSEICDSLSVRSVTGVPIQMDPGVMVPTESTTNSTVATLEANTSAEEPDCVQPGITIGVSLATFVVGIFCGLLIPLIFWAVRQKGGKDMSQRRLPDIPIAQTQLQFRTPPNSIPELHHTTSYSSSNGTQTTTPTPTDNQRLLAGQTPNNYPPADHHPLNPQPYATTEEMKVLHLESIGQAYPSPVKNPLGFNTLYNNDFSGTTPMTHTIISTEFPGQYLQASSPEQDSILRDSHYAREGDKMELRIPREVAFGEVAFV